MGDAESSPIRLSFNPQLRVEFRGAMVTSDSGLLLPRELDERLGFSALRLAGYEDTNEAERLAEDPTFRMLASRSAGRRASRSRPRCIRDRGPGGGAELRRTDALERGPDSTRGGAIAQPTRDARHR